VTILPSPAALGTGGDIGKTPEDTGLHAFDLTAAVAIRTTFRLTARFAAGPLAFGTMFRSVNIKFFVDTESRFGQCDCSGYTVKSDLFPGPGVRPAALPPKKASKISPNPKSKPS